MIWLRKDIFRLQKKTRENMFYGRQERVLLLLSLQGFVAIQAISFTQNPPARITKSVGDNVVLKWSYSILQPSELVRLQCGYLNESRKMTKLMEQFSTEFQPRITVTGTKFENRAYIENGALILTNLRADDNGIYYCVMKVYDSVLFQTVTIQSSDTYLSVGGPKSEERSGMSSETRTTIIVIIVVVVVLVIAFLAYIYYQKRARKNRTSTPKTYEDVEDAKNGNVRYTKNGKIKEESKYDEKRALNGADIEIVASPMDAVRKQKNERSYSSQKAYELIDKDEDSKSEIRESWPEPPITERSKLSDDRAAPPNRAPPRVLPKPPIHKTANGNMFI